MSTTTKDMNKTATQAPRGVERAKAWFLSGPISGPMVPPTSVTNATSAPTTIRIHKRPRPAKA
jgi:hypothetical protein